jgi:hypothetical protein
VAAAGEAATIEMPLTADVPGLLADHLHGG